MDKKYVYTFNPSTIRIARMEMIKELQDDKEKSYLCFYNGRHVVIQEGSKVTKEEWEAEQEYQDKLEKGQALIEEGKKMLRELGKK